MLVWYSNIVHYFRKKTNTGYEKYTFILPIFGKDESDLVAVSMIFDNSSMDVNLLVNKYISTWYLASK